MSKWTPGPWATDETEHEVPYQAIRILGNNRGICSIWMDDAPVHDFNAEQRANARLIAAAPEMATMIEQLLVKGSRWHPCDPLVVEARALLARINGDEK